jgi:hypothetical protein
VYCLVELSDAEIMHLRSGKGAEEMVDEECPDESSLGTSGRNFVTFHGGLHVLHKKWLTVWREEPNG